VKGRFAWVGVRQQFETLVFQTKSRNCAFKFDTLWLRAYHPFMPVTLDAIAHDALVLPPDQRVELAYRLLASVEPEPEPGADAAWEAAITERIARFDAGKTATVPAAEVFARLREIAPGR
jgi:putative addiction module component (TIGR02574 family)